MARWLLVLGIALVACSNGETRENGEEPTPGDTGFETVEQLVFHLSVPNFDAAAVLTIPGDAALASLAEGAAFEVVAAALVNGDEQIASNFWAGFAQGAGAFLTDEIELEASAPMNRNGVEFEAVAVTSAEAGDRKVLTRGQESQMIDLFASFGAGLAEPMVPRVEELLGSTSEDASLILQELNEVVPSLLVASGHPWVSSDESLHLLRLVELVTRVR